MKKSKAAHPIFTNVSSETFRLLVKHVMGFPYKFSLNPPTLKAGMLTSQELGTDLRASYADDYDINSTYTKYRAAWRQHFPVTSLHGMPTNKKGQILWTRA